MIAPNLRRWWSAWHWPVILSTAIAVLIALLYLGNTWVEPRDQLKAMRQLQRARAVQRARCR